jgi:hypothetical protein
MFTLTLHPPNRFFFSYMRTHIWKYISILNWLF